ncbi:MAG: terminase gpA endonuclease subunit [Vicinamibacterales bacterium]
MPLFLIGVDSAKELIYARLRIDKPGPAYMHFPDTYHEDYFDQLSAERVVTKYHHGHARRIWVKMRPRNEALDCRVLNVAALGALLSMGLDLSRVAERLSSFVHAVAAGERSTTEAQPAAAGAISGVECWRRDVALVRLVQRTLHRWS